MEEKENKKENVDKVVEKKDESTVKKSILPRTAVKGLINGFISYGILLIFIFLTITIFTTWVIDNNMEAINYDVLKYTLPLMAAFLVFFLVRATCRLSTFDLFKNCKIKKEEVDAVCTKMNFFYICLVAFSVVTIIIYLITRFSNERVQISRDVMFYSQTDSVFAEEKEQDLIEAYEVNKANTLVQTLIVEMGLLLGIFSLIPNQRRLIEKYN